MIEELKAFVLLGIEPAAQGKETYMKSNEEAIRDMRESRGIISKK